MTKLRFAISTSLTLVSLAWLIFSSPAPVVADNITVGGSVNEISSLSLSTNSVTMDAGNPGETKTRDPAVTVTVRRSGSGNWQINTRSLAASLTNGSGTISVDFLKWKGGDATDYTSFTTSSSKVFGGNGPTATNGQAVPLSFSLTYPGTASPGTYTVQIEIVLT